MLEEVRSKAETAVLVPEKVYSKAPSAEKLREWRNRPQAAVENLAPASKEEAKELLARAVSEVALQKGSLRRLKALLKEEDSTKAVSAWREVLSFLKETKSEGGGGKPVQIQVNNLIPRPG